MKLEREREVNYKVSILKDYAEMQLLSIEFDAIDNSKIYSELAVKKDNNKGIILEIPDYEEVPSNEVNLMKYCVLGFIDVKAPSSIDNYIVKVIFFSKC